MGIHVRLGLWLLCIFLFHVLLVFEKCDQTFAFVLLRCSFAHFLRLNKSLLFDRVLLMASREIIQPDGENPFSPRGKEGFHREVLRDVEISPLLTREQVLEIFESKSAQALAQYTTLGLLPDDPRVIEGTERANEEIETIRPVLANGPVDGYHIIKYAVYPGITYSEVVEGRRYTLQRADVLSICGPATPEGVMRMFANIEEDVNLVEYDVDVVEGDTSHKDHVQTLQAFIEIDSDPTRGTEYMKIIKLEPNSEGTGYTHGTVGLAY